MEENNSQILENAHAEFKRENFKMAEELYTKFISSCLQSRECEASSLATAYNNRGQIKYLRVDFREAVDDYTSAIQADSQFEVPFYNRGLIRYRLGSTFIEEIKGICKEKRLDFFELLEDVSPLIREASSVLPFDYDDLDD